MSKKNKSSLFGMLIRHYLFFTLAIVIVLGSLYGMAYKSRAEIWKIPEVESLIEYQEAIVKGEYNEVPVEKLLGRESYIEVLDQNLNSVYRSRKDIPKGTYNQGEIDCIREYSDMRYVSVDTYETKTGEKQTLIIIEDGQNDQEKEYILLDEKLELLTSNKEQSKKQYTPEELVYLSGEVAGEYAVWKHVYSNGYTLLMYIPYLKDKDIDRYINAITLANYIFIVFYGLMILLFVSWLNRKVKKPLTLLNTAISRFTNSQSEVVIDYTGPNEFVEICESFNVMSNKLCKSEKRRQELEQEKQKILADISHDLKTPITVIQGYSKAICDGLVKEKDLKQYLITINHKADGLTGLINTFYEYSKLEHPEFKLNLECKDLCEYLRAYLAEKYNEVNLLGFEIDIDIPEETLMCNMDSLQLRRAFENIIVNSLKHNPVGTTLYVMIRENEEYIEVTLGDDGVGIPAHLIGTIFKPFVVGDDSRNNKQGSGLGLAISQRIIEAHGGTIRVVVPPTSPYHTQFSIQIPKL